ncbi:MAG: hypothetical protein QNK23_05515 [Crocinitomicaceae bacterium]|nr:hypothetical protein [Crocinitomicaceae bacterium]
MKNVLVGLLVLVFLFTSCVKQNPMDVVIDVCPEDLLSEMVHAGSQKEFDNVYFETMLLHELNDGDFIDQFFNRAEIMYPNKKFISYFKSFDGELAPNASNEEVIEFFQMKKQQAMDAVGVILEARFDGFNDGVQINRGLDQITIQLYNIEDEKRVYSFIQKSGNVEFLEIYRQEEIASFMFETFELSEDLRDDIGEYFQVYGAGVMFVKETDLAAANNRLEELDRIENFPEELKFMWSAAPEENYETGEMGYILYPCRYPNNGIPYVSGRAITSASMGFNSDNNELTVNLTMTAEGSDKWARMTENNVGRAIAITMDDQVYSAPNVISAITGGDTQISGNFTEEEAEDLAQIIGSGSFPISCKIRSIKKH